MREKSQFTLQYNLEVFERLDRLALLSCQEYNNGNANDWFGNFRGGLYGMYSRMWGVSFHYQDVHSWKLKPRTGEAEYHLASIFFHMDSAIECCVFMMNALGNGICPEYFRAVTSDNELRRISPSNILDDGGRHSVDGYRRYFRTFREHWVKNKELLSIIFEQHDVSKHRETIMYAGQHRMDPPKGFYEALGIAGDRNKQLHFHPMEEFILKPFPKMSKTSRRSMKERPKKITLEEISPQFVNFMMESGVKALADARDSIKLKHRESIIK